MRNREIKFRIWDKDNEMFDYINLYDLENTIEQLENIKNYFSNEYFEEIEIQQYTGLKDKNGKEIYEGDIVQYKDSKYIIKFKKGRFLLFNDINNELASGLIEDDYTKQEDKVKIIGNIYENPELLEVEE